MATWNVIKDANTRFPTKRSLFSASVVGQSNIIYVFGGVQKFASDFWKFDAETQEWTEITVPLLPNNEILLRHDSCAVGDKLFVFGGWNGLRCTDDLYIFDTVSQRWETAVVTGEVGARRSHTITYIGYDRVVVFGGKFTPPDNNESAEFRYNDTLVLNTNIMEWSSKAVKGEVPLGRAGHSAVLIGYDLYIFGGENMSLYLNDLYALNTMTWQWRRIEPITTTKPCPRINFASAAVGWNMLVFGGWSGTTDLNDLFLFDTGNREWLEITCTGRIPKARCGHKGVVVGNNRFITFGGSGGMDCVDMHEISFSGVKPPQLFDDLETLSHSTSTVKHPTTTLYNTSDGSNCSSGVRIRNYSSECTRITSLGGEDNQDTEDCTRFYVHSWVLSCRGLLTTTDT